MELGGGINKDNIIYFSPPLSESSHLSRSYNKECQFIQQCQFLTKDMTIDQYNCLQDLGFNQNSNLIEPAVLI